MSDDESDDLPSDIVDLAEEYLDLVVWTDDTDTEEGDIGELREKLDQWEDDLEDLDEDDELYSIGVAERDNIEEQIAAHDREEERRERVQRRLIERTASEFVAKGKWIELPVVKAVAHELVGEVREEILVDEYQLPNDDLDNESMFTVSRNIRAIASHKLGDDERVSTLWEGIEGTRQYAIVEELSRSSDLLGPSDIAERIQDEDRDRRHIGDAISKMRDRQYHPYYRSDGGYTLSFVGEYIWREFGPDDVDDLEEEELEEKEGQSADSELTNFQNE